MNVNTQPAGPLGVPLIDLATGLPSAEALERLLTQMIQQGGKSVPPFALLIVQVHGELEGRSLRAVGRTFESCLRRSDRLAHYEGNQ